MNEHAAYLSGIDLGIEHDLGALELELAGVEYGMVHGIGYGDLGARGAGAAGAAGGTVAAAGGMTALSATTAGTGIVAACINNPISAAVCGSAAVIGGAVGALTSWRASVKNVARLKAKIESLKTKMKAKIKGARTSGRKRRLKRRYERRIKRAEKRIARIIRVMKRRIERRQGKGKDLTARQKRMKAALGMGRKKRKKRKAKPAPKQSGRYATKSGNLPDADGLPAITRAEDAMLDADMAAEGDGDLFDMEDDPIYKQPWFLAVAGVVAIGGVIYITRQKPKK